MVVMCIQIERTSSGACCLGTECEILGDVHL